MSMTNYLEDAILNHIFRGVAFPVLPASLHVALFTAAPSDAGGGTEVTGGAYARVAVGRATTAWAVPADSSGVQQTNNAAAVSFASPTVRWGYVGYQALMDAPTLGNMLYWGPIGTNTTLAAGITATALSLTVTSAAGFPASGSFVILVEGELMEVTAGAGTTTWTVTRAFSGSAAAAHSAGVPVVQPRLINAGDIAPSFAASTMTFSQG